MAITTLSDFRMREWERVGLSEVETSGFYLALTLQVFSFAPRALFIKHLEGVTNGRSWTSEARPELDQI